MQPFSEFFGEDPTFWANVRFISERLGYSHRRTKRLRHYTFEAIVDCYGRNGLDPALIFNRTTGEATGFGNRLLTYLNKRNQEIETVVIPNLMDRDQARREFEQLRERLHPRCKLPMNKQKGEKRHFLYLTGIVNMLTEEILGSGSFDDDPHGLTIFTDGSKPIRTFGRWLDGAYPRLIDPKAIWQVKEYYGTTTFGSRVADAVYETMLDGEQIKELKEKTRRHVLHYLIVDDRYTWGELGKSYLCRIVDILHEGLIDEALFGKEVLTRWPEIVKSWPR